MVIQGQSQRSTRHWWPAIDPNLRIGSSLLQLCSQPTACHLLPPARSILALNTHAYATFPHFRAPEGPFPFWENPLHPSLPGMTFPLILTHGEKQTLQIHPQQSCKP